MASNQDLNPDQLLLPTDVTDEANVTLSFSSSIEKPFGYEVWRPIPAGGEFSRRAAFLEPASPRIRGRSLGDGAISRKFC